MGGPSPVYDPSRSEPHSLLCTPQRWRETHEGLKDFRFEKSHKQHVTSPTGCLSTWRESLHRAQCSLRPEVGPLLSAAPIPPIPWHLANSWIGLFFPPSSNYWYMYLSSPEIQSLSDQILNIKTRLKYFRLTFFFLLTTSMKKRIMQSFIG